MPFDYQMVTFEEIIKNDFFKWVQYFNKKRPLRRFSAAFFMGITPPYSSSSSSSSRGMGSFFPKSGSILRKAVTTKVMVQHAMTMMKNRR